VFTGDEYGEGGAFIAEALRVQKVKASFFFTGRFYRNTGFQSIISLLKKEGHYLGAHSDQHLLYADWSKRDSLLVSEEEFKKDLDNNYSVMKNFGISRSSASLFLPSYECYNDSIVSWSRKLGLHLINFTPGTLSHTDYTEARARNYRSSAVIWNSIIEYEQKSSSHLNGFILLMHIGAGPGRRDKFFHQLPALLQWLRIKGYKPVRINELL